MPLLARDLRRLADESFDLLILGGGVNGLATAWDAVRRGLKVALIEKGDFGAATSSATLKIVHGGLRYLQHLDFVRMIESIRERSSMLAMAPHLVSPMPFVMPTRGVLLNSPPALLAGLVLNDAIGFNRNRRLRDPARRIPMGRMLSRKRCLELAPALDPAAVSGGVIFHDAQMYNSERLTLSFALSAAGLGAALANYTAAVRLLRDGGRVVGARARSETDGTEFDIRAKLVANMTGPWSDIVLGLLDRPDPPRRVLRSKGIQIVVPRLPGGMAFAAASRYKDPDALFSLGARHYFITPWRGVWLAGTTDTVYEGDPDGFRITAADIREFVDELNGAMPAAQIRAEDVPFAFGGLRPITEKNLDSGSKVARRYEITDHRADGGVEGLISVVGVKYTTCRWLAEQVVDRAVAKLGRPAAPCTTAFEPLEGGDIASFDDFLAGELKVRPAGLPEAAARHLALSYGRLSERVKRLAAERPELAGLIPGSSEVTRAEIAHAAREESALRLEDAVLRRTDLGTLGHPGRAALESCAAIMAAELGWDAARAAREIESIERIYRRE